MNVDEEYEEEEYTVYLDLESLVAPEELDNIGVDFKIIGVDSENPIVQVNGKLFKGTYDFCIGTNVFFEEDPSPPVVDPLFDITPNQFYRIYALTRKVLKMELIFAEKLRASDKASDCDVIAELKVRKTPNMTYSDALNLLLPEFGVPPREIPPVDEDIVKIRDRGPLVVDSMDEKDDQDQLKSIDEKLNS